MCDPETEKSSGLRCLVFGGAGFLGSNLCAELLRRGHHVWCVDDLSTGNMDNIRHLMTNPKFHFIEHDVRYPLHMTGSVPDQVHWHWAFHLASAASPPAYQSDPLKTIGSNVDGTRNLLEMARKGEVGRVLMTSTSEIYGDPEVHPQREDYWGHVNTVGPRSCYDESKRLAETLCYEYAHCHGIQVRLVRLFNTFGPHLAPGDGRVVSNLIRQRLDEKPLTVYGDGSQTRTLIYVDDTIDGLLRAMACDNGAKAEWFPECPPTLVGPINLGGQREMTILQIAEIIINHIGPGIDFEIQHLPLPRDDPTRRKPDISLAKRLLDWEPRVPIEDGIVRYARWMSEGAFPWHAVVRQE